MRKLKNKKGLLSIEALISVSLFLMIILILVNLIMLVYAEEKIEHHTYDLIREIEIYNYIYEKIGPDEVVDLEYYQANIKHYLEKIPDLNPAFIGFFNLDRLVGYESKVHLLSTIFKSNLEKEIYHYKWNRQLNKYDFRLNDDRLQINFSYDVNIFGYNFELTHFLNKQLWLFGDEADEYPNTTLVSLLKDAFTKEKNITVYKTKTGKKYHKIDCFYIVRSTTDKSQVAAISLFEAKYLDLLNPCSRCIGENYEN